MCNRFPVHVFLLDPYTLGGVYVTVLALLMEDSHLKIHIPPFVIEISKKI